MRLLKLPWWPVDKVILAYFAAALLLLVAGWPRIPYAAIFVLFHLAGAAALVVALRHPGNRFWHAFHHWYPLLYVATCYREMSFFIPAFRSSAADNTLVRWDLAIWGANPTVWLERWLNWPLVEALQIVYAGFVPVVLLAAVIFWLRRDYSSFRYYAFLIALGFLASYIGYILVPARGPRFVLAHLQSVPLEGGWLFSWLRETLDQLERPHYDCFPSGHTELTILAWWGSRSISKVLFRVMFVYTLGVVFATVFLRYHYTVDVMAGVALAAVLLWTSPRMYRHLGGDTVA
jgi:membrane-associated phospholipid phosphatase